MKKLYPLLPVLFLIYWGCLDPLNIFDSNDEETGPSVNLWGVDYSIDNTTSLNLNGKQLTGSIPPEIGDLTNLTKLDLGSNQFTGSIPPEIGNLTNLTILSLWGNELTGSIPPQIGNMSNLERLELMYNQLTGSIPPEIGNLTNLERLQLDDNQLTGSIPPEIGNLTNLESLQLEDNQLTGSIPPEIENLTDLVSLDLRINQLTGSVPSEIGNLINLNSLYLSDNNLTGVIPNNICDLDISWWKSSGFVMNPEFFISGNQFCPPYPSCIEDYMGEQDVCSCGLDDDEVVYLWGNCYSIEYTTEINLSNSGLTGEIPESICDLNIDWSSFWVFNIFNNQLCPPYPSCVEDYVGVQDTSDCD